MKNQEKCVLDPSVPNWLCNWTDQTPMHKALWGTQKWETVILPWGATTRLIEKGRILQVGSSTMGI